MNREIPHWKQGGHMAGLQRCRPPLTIEDESANQVPNEESDMERERLLGESLPRLS